jgi:PKD repeat protein
VEDLEKRELLATTLTAPLHYDFGTTTSPVATGYTGVSLLAYTDTLGYGWQSLSGLSAVDRNTSNALTTDFVRGSDGTFLVNLPNDTYSVTPTLGDVKGSTSGVNVYAQGQRVGHGLYTNYGQIKTPTYTVQLTNGQLQLEFKSTAGGDSYFALDGLDIVVAPGSPPTANAGPSQTVNEGSAVAFAGSASGSSTLSYLWDFGDGTTASGTLTPTHTYAAGSGTFTVTLTVTDANNQTAQATTTVTVNNLPPTGNPGGPYTGDAGSAIAFAATATDPGAADTAAGFTFAWDFGDGTTASGASPSHAYAALGTYTVTLTTTDASEGSSTATTTATANAAPTANAGPSQTVNEGTAVTFAGSATGSSALTYLWNFGDGGTASGTLSPTYTYAAGTGTFTVTLTVTDAVGVSAQSTTTVTINNLPPTGNPGGPYTGDAGAAIGFAATATDPGAADTAAGFTYAWDFGDGATASGASPSHAYAAVGTYTVTLTTTDASGGSSSTTTTATVNPAPTANAGPSQTVNEGSAVTFAGAATGSSSLTYLWNFGDGGTASGTLSPTYTYAAGSGTFTVTLTVTDAVGVSAQSTTTVTITNLPPTGNPGGPYTADAGSAIAFAATATDPGAADTAAGFTYAWDFGDGATASGASPSHAFASVGTYTVTLTTTDASGGSSTATTTATIKADPTANAGNSQTVNEGSAVTFAGAATGSSALTYLWSFGDGVTASGSLSPTHTYAAANGSFTVTLTVTDALGGSAQSTTTVTINNLPPTGNPGGPYSGHTGSAIVFNGTATDPGAADTAAGFTYTWNFGDGTTASGASPSHSYSAAGTYTVTMTVADAEGASSSSTTTATLGSSVYVPTTGIYSLCPGDGQIPSGILSNKYVDGIAVRADWSFIESSQGVYNWSYLDSMINAATAAGKKVALSIKAGALTPAWVYAAGAQSFTFITATSPTAQTIPVPWDPVFLTQWTNLITALGNRYSSNATLTQVKLTGINYVSSETGLPRSTGVQVTSGGKTWTTTNDVANWVAASYTRTKVENAWQTIADAWAKAFPQQQIASELTPYNFPPIDNNGNVFSNPQGGDNQIQTDFINLGMARYGTQFVAQNDGLSDTWIFQSIANVADQVTTGYEMLWYVTGDTTYRMNGGTAIAITTELQNAVNAALAAHARFLDIYPEDITNSSLQNVLASTHTGLVSNNLPLGMITGLPAPGSLLEGSNTITLGSALADPTTTSSSGFTYAWTVQHNSQTVTTGSASGLTFTATDWGNYAVSLQVTDPAGKSSFVNTQTISIINVAPTITQFSVPLTLAQGIAGTFSAAATDPGPADTAAGFTYSWKFGDTGTATGSSVTHSYKYNGTYTVTLTVMDAGGSTTTTTTSIAVPKPTHSPEGAAISLSASSLPAPTGASFTGATYAWTVTKNGASYATGTAANFTFTPNDLSAYVMTLTVTPASGPSWTNTIEYVIDNLPPTITKLTVPSTATKGSKVQMSVTATDPGAADMAAGLSYTWTFGDGSPAVTGVSSLNHTYNSRGTFTVTVTVADQEGAKTKATATITVS